MYLQKAPFSKIKLYTLDKNLAVIKGTTVANLNAL